MTLAMKRNGLLGGSAVGEGSNRVQRKEHWRSVWALPCQGKIQHFVWKCFHDILPVNDVLVRRHLANDVLCPLCKEDRESVVCLLDAPLHK